MLRLLLIDNIDSFVHNIAQLLREVGVLFDVADNRVIPFERLGDYGGIVLSPGPGIPDEAGGLLKLLAAAHRTHPILGICLGHQALAQYFGARLQNITPCHGVQSALWLCNGGDLLFDGIAEDDLLVGRYHSWVVDRQDLPACLVPTAFSTDGQLMAFRHASLPLRGVQFHPESFMTPCGAQVMRHWLAGL